MMDETLRGCVHCGHIPANRPRGLCNKCYRNMSIRNLYGATGRYGILDFMGSAKKTEPTMSLPGTQDKVAIMMERAERGETLWHHADAERDMQ